MPYHRRYFTSYTFYKQTGKYGVGSGDGSCSLSNTATTPVRSYTTNEKIVVDIFFIITCLVGLFPVVVHEKDHPGRRYRQESLTSNWPIDNNTATIYSIRRTVHEEGGVAKGMRRYY